MASLVVAVLAHDRPDLLREMVDNIRYFAAPEEIVVFNGGVDQELARDLDVSVCPHSAPIRLGNLVPFHVGVMRWLVDRGSDFDFLLTMDSDMLFLRSGVDEYFESVMANSAYMGVGYLVSNEWVAARIPLLRRFNASWRRYWQPLIQTEVASWAANPGQVFRREYAEKLLGYPALADILKLARRSRLYAIEEFVYPTLAEAMECNPIRLPEPHGVQVSEVTLDDLCRGLDTPTAHYLHKVSMEADDPVREAIGAIQSGRPPRLPESYAPRPQPDHAAIPTQGVRDHLKELYFRLFP